MICCTSFCVSTLSAVLAGTTGTVLGITPLPQLTQLKASVAANSVQVALE
jgi:hypothetical protein